MHEYGFKWVSNKLCAVYIVRLKLFNSFHDDRLPDEYYTTDCLVEDITRLSDHKKVYRVLNGAYFYQNYETGQRMTGNPVFYCRTIDELMRNQGRMIAERTEINKIIMGLIEAYNDTSDTEKRRNIRKGIRHLYIWADRRIRIPTCLNS